MPFHALAKSARKKFVTLRWWIASSRSLALTWRYGRRFATEGVEQSLLKYSSYLGEGSAPFDREVAPHELDHTPLMVVDSTRGILLIVPREVPRSSAQSSYLATYAYVVESVSQLSDVRVTRIQREHVVARTRELLQLPNCVHLTLFVEMEPGIDLSELTPVKGFGRAVGMCQQCREPKLVIVVVAYDTEDWKHVKSTFLRLGGRLSFYRWLPVIVDLHHGPLSRSAPKHRRPRIAHFRQLTFIEQYRFVDRTAPAGGSPSKHDNSLALVGTSKYLRPVVEEFLSPRVQRLTKTSLTSSIGRLREPHEVGELLAKADALINISWRPRRQFGGLYVSGTVFLALAHGCQVISFRPSDSVSLSLLTGFPPELIWEFKNKNELLDLLYRLSSESKFEKTERRRKLEEWVRDTKIESSAQMWPSLVFPNSARADGQKFFRDPTPWSPSGLEPHSF